MDIFIHGIPKPATDIQLKQVLSPHLQKLNIYNFDCHKPKNKGCANLRIHDVAQGELFLSIYATRTDIRLSPRFPLTFKKNYHQDGGARMRDEKFMAKAPPVQPLDLGQQFSGE